MSECGGIYAVIGSATFAVGFVLGYWMGSG